LKPASAEPAQDHERLLREIEHHRRIATRAEAVWSWDSPAGSSRADRRARLFVEHAALAPGVRALELGCGTGVFLERVAGCGATIAGLDLSPELLARAQGRLAGVSSVALLRGNAEEMPLREHAFDSVYGSSILHHLDLDRALTELHRVLRPGGRLVFAEPNILNPQIAFIFGVRVLRERFGVSPDEMAFSRFRAQAALRRAGFCQESVVPFDFVHPAVPSSCIAWIAGLGRLLEATPLAREIAGSLLIRARRP
jgi:SAM-dependent methyltransferase